MIHSFFFLKYNDSNPVAPIFPEFKSSSNDFHKAALLIVLNFQQNGHLIMGMQINKIDLSEIPHSNVRIKSCVNLQSFT